MDRLLPGCRYGDIMLIHANISTKMATKLLVPTING